MTNQETRYEQRELVDYLFAWHGSQTYFTPFKGTAIPTYGLRYRYPACSVLSAELDCEPANLESTLNYYLANDCWFINHSSLISKQQWQLFETTKDDEIVLYYPFQLQVEDFDKWDTIYNGRSSTFNNFLYKILAKSIDTAIDGSWQADEEIFLEEINSFAKLRKAKEQHLRKQLLSNKLSLTTVSIMPLVTVKAEPYISALLNFYSWKFWETENGSEDRYLSSLAFLLLLLHQGHYFKNAKKVKKLYYEAANSSVEINDVLKLQDFKRILNDLKILSQMLAAVSSHNCSEVIELADAVECFFALHKNALLSF